MRHFLLFVYYYYFNSPLSLLIALIVLYDSLWISSCFTAQWQLIKHIFGFVVRREKKKKIIVFRRNEQTAVIYQSSALVVCVCANLRG